MSRCVQKNKRRGETSFGRRSDDTAHPSHWQVPAVAPPWRTQTNRDRQRAALHSVNTQSPAAGKEIKTLPTD